MAELQPDGVRTDLDSTNVVEEAHVPDGEDDSSVVIDRETPFLTP